MVKISPPSRKIILSSGWSFFVLGIIFTVLWFGLSYYYRPTFTGTSSAHHYYSLYGIYLPLALGLLTILKSYILTFLAYILHVRGVIIKGIIGLLLYGFWLTLGIQLAYYEPRYTDIAIVLIDAYGFSLMVAAGVTLFFIFLSFFIRKK